MEEKWYVVYTKSRGEKKVAEQLNALGMQAYCPVKTEVRLWSDRKKKVDVPLLPSMVLVKLKEADRNRVFEVSGVVRYMFWGGEPVEVREHEVQVLKEVEQNNGMELHAVEAIGPGTQLELSSFGFENQSGEVKHVSGNQCWVVLKELGYVVKLRIQ